MKPYVGAKIVKAKPMSFAEFKENIKGEGGMFEATEDERGYLVEYPDGYQGWNKKKEFERCSREVLDDEFDMMGARLAFSDPEWTYYLTTKILGLFEIGNDGDEGGEYYIVYYPNGHQSWAPKIKTDEVYREINEDEFMIMNQGFEDNSQKPETGSYD